MPVTALLFVLGAFAGASRAAAAQYRLAAPPSCNGAQSMPDGHNAALIDSATLCLTNQLRRSFGLRPLRANRALQAIASGQAHDMVRGDYFGDRSRSGKTPLARILASSYLAQSANLHLLAAQNIGWGTGIDGTPAGIVKAFMESPPHRRIMLTGAYRDIGVGVAPSVPSPLGEGWLGGTYAVEFAVRRR